jgi:hypothetical protein
MDLSNNSITEIRIHDLRGYNSIRILNLSKNRINSIYENSFRELVNLKYVYLSENDIVYLPPATFDHNVSLQKLYLKGNPLLLPNNTSLLVSDSMTYLDIAFCNITLLPVESFVTIPNLVALRLDGNVLKNITTETFETLRNLKEVYMESETLRCVESSLQEFLNYLENRGIRYYGPPVCSEESLTTVPPTLKITVPVSTLAVFSQVDRETTSAIPRTMSAILETPIPTLKETPLIFNQTRQTANTSSSVTHNPVLLIVSYPTQTNEESTFESLPRSYSPNLEAVAVTTLAIYFSLLYVL